MTEQDDDRHGGIPRTPESLRDIWALAFKVATPLGLSSVAVVYFGMIWSRKPLTFKDALLTGLGDWYFWAALTPVVFWLGRRFPIVRGQWPKSITVHVLAGLITVLIELALVTAFERGFYNNPWVPTPNNFWEAYRLNVFRFRHFAFIIYCLIVAAAHAFDFYRRYQQREMDASRLREANAELQAQLTQAQLDVLRAQLNPHFLFNALNTISAFVREQRNAEAGDLVAQLGQLLRQALRFMDQDEVPLRSELKFLEAYIAIERARFRDRLEVSFDVDHQALDVQVPTMILQPLVENAIRHGLEGATTGRISIVARRLGGRILLEVRDNGRGFDSRPLNRDLPSVGLANTRTRLDKLYGANATFEIGPAAGSGTLVTIALPAPDVERRAG
jgi:two-component system, LytTR family, sensor kinase